MPLIDETFLQEYNRWLPSQSGLGSRGLEQGQGPRVRVKAVPMLALEKLTSREPARLLTPTNTPRASV